MTERATAASLRLVLVSITLANAMILVDQTAVPLILPSVMNTFHIGSAPAQWVLNASLLPLAGLLVLGLLGGGGSSCSGRRCSAAPRPSPGWRPNSGSCCSPGWCRGAVAR